MKDKLIQAVMKGANAAAKAFVIAFFAALGISQISPDVFNALVKLLGQ